MKGTLIILLFSSFFSCQGQNQNVTISSIDRKVYLHDTLHSNTFAYFNDTSKIFILRSEEIIKNVEINLLDSIVKNGKYVVYEILLSNDAKKIIKVGAPRQNIDNLMRFDGGINGDDTFEVNWWFKEDEIKTIIIPSSEFNK